MDCLVTVENISLRPNVKENAPPKDRFSARKEGNWIMRGKGYIGHALSNCFDVCDLMLVRRFLCHKGDEGDEKQASKQCNPANKILQ